MHIKNKTHVAGGWTMLFGVQAFPVHVLQLKPTSQIRPAESSRKTFGKTAMLSPMTSATVQPSEPSCAGSWQHLCQALHSVLSGRSVFVLQKAIKGYQTTSNNTSII